MVNFLSVAKLKFDLNWPAENLMLNEFYNNIIDRFYVLNKLLFNAVVIKEVHVR